MKIGNLKISVRLALGFTVVIILAVVAIIIAIINLQKLSNITSDMYKHPLTVGNSTREVKSNVAIMQSIMKDIVLGKDQKKLNLLSEQIDTLERRIYSSFDIVSERFLGPKLDVNEALRSYNAWKQSRDKIIQLIMQGDSEKAAKVFSDEGTPLFLTLEKQIDDIIVFANGKSVSFFNNAQAVAERIVYYSIILVTLIFLTSLAVAIIITLSINKPLALIVDGVNSIAKGDYQSEIQISSTDEVGVLASAVNKMTHSLRQLTEVTQRQDWFKTGQNTLNEKMRGDIDIYTLADNITEFLCEYLNAKVSALYLLEDDKEYLNLTGSYAFTKRKSLNDRIKIKEGLVGQSALTKKQISLTNLPEDYTRISSAIGDSTPKNVLVTPIIHENQVIGVIELGSFHIFSDTEIEFIQSVIETISIGITSAKSRTALKELLKKTQQQAEELQAQQEDLKAANEELEEQTQLLKQSEEKLKTQQEELEVTNEELEEKNESLQRQKSEIENARQEIEIKAEELAIASKYKSEFLANMSHELRTPLNSLLILAKILTDNKTGNLTKDQVESADVIYKSGVDLLTLINEILDLSKIEAGRMDLNLETIPIQDFALNLEKNFKAIIEEKKLSLEVIINPNAAKSIENDKQRIDQIIKNLMSNAIKFTRRGGIIVEFCKPTKDVNLFRSGLSSEKSIAISIKDTGIGIAQDKQKIIFEAFQQAEGGTAREYGGTGLGLSISRELANLLGGEIQLESELGKGSTFTLYLPLKTDSEKKLIETRSKIKDYAQKGLTIATNQTPSAEKIADDRDNLENSDKTILVIEDDPKFAKILLEQCHQKGFKGLVAYTGEDGLQLVNRYLPIAVILDLQLPGINGWNVLELLKENPKTRHIPVHIMSIDDATIEAYRKGAMGYLTKPVDKAALEDAFKKLEEFSSGKIKDLLIIEDDKKLQMSITKLIDDSDVNIKAVASGSEAIEEIKKTSYDCIILDIGLPDISGFDLLKELEKLSLHMPPVIVYTGKDLSKEEELVLRNYAESIIIKGVKSEERLLDETSLFLHRIVAKMPDQKRKMILNLHETDSIFKDKKLLIVDDDMRNVFALSKVLIEKGFKLYKAEDGNKALDILKKEPNIDIVLMDIMMPGLDGYETIKKIRAQERFFKLPIIAVTAKAMKKDYEHCIAAGASDYLSKPVDLNRLYSMMRVWLYR